MSPARYTRTVTLPVKAASQYALEQWADKLLGHFYPENLSTPTYLDVIDLLDGLDQVGVGFGVSDLGPLEEGYVDPTRSEIIIALDVYEGLVRDEGRARMTCCHEIGHIPHITQVQEAIRDGARLRRALNVEVPVYQDPEWQAKVIASALLMPRSTFGQVFREGGLLAISETFGVTHSAAKVRFQTLGRHGWLL